MLRPQKHASAAAAAKKAAAAIRAQLHQELENKKLCGYQPHECTQLTLDGYNYCLRHIMEDKTAPYRQCSFLYNIAGKKCHLPALKSDKKEFCKDHAFKCHLQRIKAASKHYPSNSVESVLDSLSHHVIPNTVKPMVKTEEVTDDSKEVEETLKVTNHLDPFTEIDAATILSSRSRILDFGSESDSDVEPANYSSVWHDAHADSSDDESIDSEQEDILKHAGIYTAEEVTLVTRDKLIRLQSLYIEQFKHLQHVLKERRRKYLYGLKREKDSLCSIYDQVKDTPKEKKMYNKLRAFNHYHKKCGIDAIMNKKLTELRAKVTDNITTKSSSFTKCSFVEGGVKCMERALPVTKHCPKHILHDRNQILFKRCCHVQDDFECNEPILGIYKDGKCKFHTDFPPIRNYGETRTFDDSDLDNSSDTHDQHVIDFIASSSCDSKAPATITSSDLGAINFSNQFPPTKVEHIFNDQSIIKNEINMELIQQDTNTSNEYLNIRSIPTSNDEFNIKQNDDDDDVDMNKDEIFTQVDDETIEPKTYEIKDNDVVPMDAEESNHQMDETTDEVESEIKSVDPDDDMAGILLEMQKGTNLHLPKP